MPTKIQSYLTKTVGGVPSQTDRQTDKQRFDIYRYSEKPALWTVLWPTFGGI